MKYIVQLKLHSINTNEVHNLPTQKGGNLHLLINLGHQEGQSLYPLVLATVQFT